MAEYRDITSKRGGFNKPVSVSNFIIEILSMGDDYISHMHKLYLDKLNEIAIANGRIQYTVKGTISRRKSKPYHKTTYHSFEMAVQKLTRAGFIEFSGHEEVSPEPRFIHWPLPPLRRYYRIVKGIKPTEIKESKRKFKSTIIISNSEPEKEFTINNKREKKAGELPIDRRRRI
jgi:hypothetical protein